MLKSLLSKLSQSQPPKNENKLDLLSSVEVSESPFDQFCISYEKPLVYTAIGVCITFILLVLIHIGITVVVSVQVDSATKSARELALTKPLEDKINYLSKKQVVLKEYYPKRSVFTFGSNLLFSEIKDLELSGLIAKPNSYILSTKSTTALSYANFISRTLSKKYFSKVLVKSADLTDAGEKYRVDLELLK